jgi:arylsulfatase A-like enzyme
MITKPLTAVCTVTALLLAGPTDARAERLQPNIIIVVADDLGYGDLGSYGQTRVSTPELDAMAAEGVRFTRFYAGGPLCAPGRDSLVTGLHTGHTRNRHDHHLALTDATPTLAEIARRAGYATGAVGKWGLGGTGTDGHPNRRGFDFFYGYLDAHEAHNYWPDHLYENESRVALRNVATRFAKQEATLTEEPVDYAPDLLLARAEAFVRDNQHRPFLLYFAPNLVHANSEFETIMGDGGLYNRYNARDWPDAQKAHASMITYLDEQMGKLLALLRALSIEQDTVVFFTSDNGPHAEASVDPAFFDSTAGLRGHKGDLYEGGLRVPLLAWWPGRIQPGVDDGLWAAWDLLATTAQLAGVRRVEGTDGISMLPSLLGESTEASDSAPHPYLYWEQYSWHATQAVLKGRWKAIRTHALEERFELYDLDLDPQELRDVSQIEPAVVAELTAIMDREHEPWSEAPLGVDWKRAFRHFVGWVHRQLWFRLAALALAISGAGLAWRRRAARPPGSHAQLETPQGG